MFDAIRQLIRDNRIADALRKMDQLDLSREHNSRLDTLHRRWRILEDKAMGNLIEERLIRIEENGIVEDVLKLLDHAEHPLPDAEIPHAGHPTGAAAGAKQVEKRLEKTVAPSGTSRLPLYLIGGLLLAVLAAWLLWPATETPEPGTSPVAEEVPAREAPATPPAKEETPTTKPATDAPTLSRTRPGVVLTDAARERLREAASNKIDERQLRVDPKLTIDPKILRPGNQALMTPGEKTPLALAVYIGTKAPTKYDKELSRYLGQFLRTRIGREISVTLLTDAFHSWDGREKLQFRGVADDTRLSKKQADHLVLVDIRNIRNGKGELRTCVFDLDRMKGFTRGKSVAIGSAGNPNKNVILEPVLSYLKELKERELFE